VRDPRPRQHLNPRRVCQDQVTARQDQPVVVPQQVPVCRQADPRQRRLPQAGRDGRVRQVQRQEVRPPAIGQPGADGPLL
jgi:hypothetical protein